MLLRLLVFIFALNVLAPPAMAVACDMMNDADMSSMSHEMPNQNMIDGEIKCSMDQDHSCNSTECITSCSASFPLLSLDIEKSFAVNTADNNAKDNLLSLYKIFLPVNNPPPLV